MVNRRERFQEVEHAENAGKTLRRVAVYFFQEKAMVLGMLAAVVFGTLCGVYAPSLQSRAIDILAGTASGNLLRTALLMLAVYVLYCLGQLLQNLISARLSQNIVRRMREELFGKIVDLPVQYLDTHSHGDVMSRMTNDVENISTTVSQSLPSLFSGVLTILGTAAIMLWYCWQLALLSLVTVILTVLATKLLSGKVRTYSRRRQALLGQLNGTVEEMVAGYRTVVAYNRQDKTTEDFCSTADSLTREGIKTDVCSGVMGPIMNAIGNIGFVIIAAFGGYFSIHGLISVGVISAFIVYAKQFSRPINEIAQVYGQLQTAIAGAERVFSVLDEADEDKSGEPIAQDSAKPVTFEGVNFSYAPQQDVPVLLESIVVSGEDGYVLTFSSTYITDEILLLRSHTATVVLARYEGLRIRNEARRVIDGQVGVFVRSGLTFEFCPIEVLYADELHSIVRWEQGKSGALKLYDEVVIGGKDLYDGKIIS